MDKADVIKKRFMTNIKLYFSSLTARRGSCLYTGITDSKNEFILSNMEPEAYVKYCDASFGIHIVKIREEVVARDIRNLFSFLQLPNNKPYMTRITAVLSMLNKVKYDLDSIKLTKDNNGIIYHIDANEKKTVLCYPMVIFQAIQIMHNLYVEYNKMSLSDTKNEIIQDINSELLKEGIIQAEFNIDSYFEACDLDCTNSAFAITLVDGAETISNREYIKKIKDAYEYKLVTWAKNGCVEYGTIYKDKHVEIKSIRPHTRIYLQKNKRRKK